MSADINVPELVLLDEDFSMLAVVMDYSSLQWTTKYYELGTFAIQVSKETYQPLISKAAYVHRRGVERLGVIDRVTGKSALSIDGRFAECLLMGRSVNVRSVYSGTREEICRAVVSDYCINNPDPDRNIKNLQLGEISGLDDTTDVQFYGETVYEAVTKMLNDQQAAFRLRYDYLTDALYFEVFKGADRTQSQDVNDWCVFSSEFFNVTNEEYVLARDYRNFAYVVNGNEDQNEDEWVIAIDLTNDGRPRREVWVQDNTKLTAEMTEEEFENSIRQTGLNKLAQYNVADTFTCEIDTGNAMFYEVGDICTYTNLDAGIVTEQRITEQREVFETRAISVSVVIGKDQVTESQKLLRAVK